MARNSTFLDTLKVLVPITIAASSLVISGYNWYNQRYRVWEKNRPLATLQLQSKVVRIDPEHRVLQFNLKAKNIGELTVVILDIQLDMYASQDLSVDWEKNTLLDDSSVELALGLEVFDLL